MSVTNDNDAEFSLILGETPNVNASGFTFDPSSLYFFGQEQWTSPAYTSSFSFAARGRPSGHFHWLSHLESHEQLDFDEGIIRDATGVMFGGESVSKRPGPV